MDGPTTATIQAFGHPGNITPKPDRRLREPYERDMIATIDDLCYLLPSAWRADTSFLEADWSADNPAVGQCAVTALVVQDLFGGDLLRGRMQSAAHYWNRLPDGREVDLTAGQFEAEPVFEEATLRSREYVLSFTATRQRYQRLRDNLGL
jgi:hypothetical protein